MTTNTHKLYSSNISIIPKEFWGRSWKKPFFLHYTLRKKKNKNRYTNLEFHKFWIIYINYFLSLCIVSKDDGTSSEMYLKDQYFFDNDVFKNTETS